MPLVLTVPITVPNIQRIDLERPPTFFADSCQCIMQIRSGPAAGRISTVEMWVRNSVGGGLCDILRVNPTPVLFSDDIQLLPNALSVPTGADQVEAAYRTGASRAAGIRAVLTTLQSLNIIQFAGTVS